MYKNLRVVRSDDPNNHPITVGPTFLHRDTNFEAYNYFFAAIKDALCESVDASELSIGNNILAVMRRKRWRKQLKVIFRRLDDSCVGSI